VNASGTEWLDFSFYPIAKSKKLFGNGTSLCPTAGEKVDGIVVDTNCDMDKLEICLTAQTPPEEKLIKFLYCFEGKHHANTSFGRPCAIESGLAGTVFDEALACFDNDTMREALWKTQLELPIRPSLTHFPAVYINGAAWNWYNHTMTFAQAIDRAREGKSLSGMSRNSLPSLSRSVDLVV